jgi:nucleoside-diphosphate-sugar epimerase
LIKSLITGGAGFVGRHLTRKLLELGWEVTVVDPLLAGSGGINPSNSWPLFDPRDFRKFIFIEQDCRKFFNENLNAEYDYVFHLAAVVGGRLTIENNPLAVASDLAIDSEMWNWSRSAKIKKVINFSSSAAYPINIQKSTNQVIKLKESMISFDENLGMPDLTYGWAKLTSEFLGKMAWEKYGVKNVAYRPFSGYGPDQDLSYPFTSICRRAVEQQGSKTFTVWGSGLQSRDFIHIDDCIDGVLKTFDQINDGSALNLSTGIPTTFIDFAKTVTKILGYSPDIISDNSKPTGVNSRVGDTTKQKIFGFKPKVHFEQGIRECLKFIEFRD